MTDKYTPEYEESLVSEKERRASSPLRHLPPIEEVHPLTLSEGERREKFNADRRYEEFMNHQHRYESFFANRGTQKAGPRVDDEVDPSHYKSHPSGVECIQVSEHMSFCVGSAIKYLWRAGKKDSAITDLKKAGWYVDREIERLSNEN